MNKLEIFDPPMCCKSGICGSSSDPTLVTFASDLEWLKVRGVEIVRHGLSLEPKEFINNENVKSIVHNEGKGSLPILMYNSKLVSKSCYPTRKKLAQICNIEFDEDDAPPIHREENCCCGIDCDCNSTKIPEGLYNESICDCSNAPAEDDCFCTTQGSPNTNKKSYNLLFIVTALIVITLIIAFKLLFK